jgi:hypothetical protein
MKRGARMRLAVLLGLAVLAAQTANAGSAVAWEGPRVFFGWVFGECSQTTGLRLLAVAMGTM